MLFWQLIVTSRVFPKNVAVFREYNEEDTMSRIYEEDIHTNKHNQIYTQKHGKHMQLKAAIYSNWRVKGLQSEIYNLVLGLVPDQGH